ncbi:MAG: isoprenylcysteine carboxylmethyltransferase family protein [Desulfobacteraceae bacterium]|jgi:protein-S-isoprenylcysteine O-methyltransferase Ste14
MVTKGMVFAVFSLGIFLKFRKELFSFHRHGPYMFVSAQGLLLLFVLNSGSMFRAPWGPQQAFSWALMYLSAGFALLGFYALRRHGKPVQNWEDTSRLVQEGVFRFIRHPLYTSLMLLAVGVFLKDVSPWTTGACLVTLGFLVAASRVEERENLVKFGIPYEHYILRTKRYLPFLV